MGKIWDWLMHKDPKSKAMAVDLLKEKLKASAEANKVLELVDEAPVEKFIDEVTKKEYKSARSLKAAITRRKNKGKKKTSKKSNK